MSDVGIDLAGKTWRVIGEVNRFTEAVSGAFARSGAQAATGGDAFDILVVGCPLLPDQATDPALLASAAAEGVRMAAGQGGRIVFLLSAIAALPIRGHVSYSSQMAGLLAGMRGLAMELAPAVLVNAVGAGLIEADSQHIAGDPNMLSHVSLGRAGRIEDIVSAVLFLCDPMNTYTTGQILNVDGGWTIGYGRNF
jgi:NAD(P)-dependent dehydrogenase (short-subunit alcohol dehydrogenase family)